MRYQMGVRIVQMSLNKHLPSHLTIVGYRALVSYEGQPQTCYGCSATTHVYQECPKRRTTMRRQEERMGNAWNVPSVTELEGGEQAAKVHTSTDRDVDAPGTGRDSLSEFPGLLDTVTPHTKRHGLGGSDAPRMAQAEQQVRTAKHRDKSPPAWADDQSEGEQEPRPVGRSDEGHPLHELVWQAPVTIPNKDPSAQLTTAANGTKVASSQGPKRSPSGKMGPSVEPANLKKMEGEPGHGKKQRLIKSNESLPERKRMTNKAPSQGQTSC
jgi:hypothetical protein